MSPNYKITLLKEERDAAPVKYRAGYNKDLRKLEKALAAIVAAEQALEAAKANFEQAWASVGN